MFKTSLHYKAILSIMTDTLNFEFVKNIFAIIGVGVLLLNFFKILFEVIPQIRNLYIKTKISILKKIDFKKFEKEAISFDVENAVNEVIEFIQPELPFGWIPKTKIEWVEKENFAEINDNEIILRLKPLKDHDYNLLNGVFNLFSSTLFSVTRSIIPEDIRVSSAMKLTHRTILENRVFLLNKFEDEFMEPIVKENPSVATYMGKYDIMDNKGFFTGVFLREIDEISMKVRFNEKRSGIGKEINNVIDHITNFISKINKAIADEVDWHRFGEVTNYGYLLVAKPVPWREVKTFVNRAKQEKEIGIDRLYVMGAQKEIKFVKDVINQISKIHGYELVECFSLHKDYRGKSGGYGALFINSKQDE